MESTIPQSRRAQKPQSLNLAIANTLVSAFMVGLEACMVVVDIFRHNGTGIFIWTFATVAALVNTALGVRKIRSAARQVTL
jgi:hypothetical protein